ncbi:GntR family transcriptional regulator [Virgibacillus pantothenticus]|uniref:GntR family transcriptional regulator n=1 Tax=Virgibacillus pantothenticus TaxID=1473 RepID=UPI000984D4F6|nr:GntR family transcriptional regulator [Virgibacillus pantothenticus]
MDNSLQSQAYIAIRKGIIYSDLKPGKKLSVKELEEELKIGRTPIRESLVRLLQQGLIYTIPQSGTYVSKIDLNSAHNSRFVREHLERQIMMECCAKITPKSKKLLEKIIEQQEKAVSNKNRREFFIADNSFHEACFEIAGRYEIWKWLDDSNTHLERFRWLRVMTEDLKWGTIMNQHYQLFDAICNKDPEEANFLTSLHLHMMLNEQEIILNNFPDYFKE